MELYYFVCTLGEAALDGISRPFRTINDLIDAQALTHPSLPAVGFYTPEDDQNTIGIRVLTFDEIANGVTAVARTIQKQISIENGQTIGLLSNSSPAFLFTWLSLMRLGHPVLLIAPQCSASAIAHLSTTCGSPLLFHDEAHGKLANEAVEHATSLGFKKMTSRRLPFDADSRVFELVSKESTSDQNWPSASETDVAYLHHTSGTSSGMPKPIPQTHRAGVGVLPQLNGESAATFTTTPLYHGGVADLFRAWTSNAMIWLFPSQHLPITAPHIVQCLNASAAVAETKAYPPIKYFSSVPYVLQMMEQNGNGLHHLKCMEIVGVGGAALPSEVGDRLVNKGVNLISRYGSAECGFLMSSYRQFEIDRDWQYLRKSEHVTKLSFETQEDGPSELIVQRGWPHMAKRNKEDGSYATSDLFTAHPTKPNAWKYHSRADSQLTLVTGKKFDPSPLEESLTASTNALGGVLIFGNGKPYPGALLFRSENATNTSDTHLIEEVAPIVERLNKESQSHARIPRSMLTPMKFTPSSLDKSSKGTILRAKAEARYSREIEGAYQKTALSDHDVSNEDLQPTIERLIKTVIGSEAINGEELTPDADLFSYGVDSVACVQIRHALSQLLPERNIDLPMTIVEESGTISKLTEAVRSLRRGEQRLEEHSGHMVSDTINKYSNFIQADGCLSTGEKEDRRLTVLLTGPTGLLGAHILAKLLRHKRVAKVYLLVRGVTGQVAKDRVLKGLTFRGLSIPSDFDERTTVLPCKFTDTDLGLSKDDYNTLVNEVDKIFHLAWSVNFLVSLRSLASTHLAGLQNLLNLAIASRRGAHLIFCSSVASVSGLLKYRHAPESIIKDTSACGRTGYSQSKLAAELICLSCAEIMTTKMKDRITIIRVGQLSGDSTEGRWNLSEAYPLMLASSKATGVLPDLKDEALGWLPADIAADSYIEAAFQSSVLHQSPNGATSTLDSSSPPIKVLHLINTSWATTFSDLVSCIIKSGESINIVPVSEWLDVLDKLQRNETTRHHPALKLLSFWKQIYGNTQSKTPSLTTKEDLIDEDNHYTYETQLSVGVMPSLKSAVGPLTDEYMLKLWKWIKENIE